MSQFVDFKAVKTAVTMLQMLEYYGLAETFKRSGNSLSGPCPLHNGENRTQFRVSLDKNCWNCFGACKGGGNVLDFVSRKENVSLREAALLLCDWFQIPTQEKAEPRAAFAAKKESQSAKKPARSSQPTAEEANEPNRPLGFALQNLDTAHPYLAERGLNEQAIAEFGLGYCQKGSMTGRVVIPIHNSAGQLVAYAGRWPGPPPEADTPKYKLPPDFRKTQELFNYHRAAASNQHPPLIVVEGFFGAMRLYQVGYERVVALMGSSLSDKQVELLCQLCEGDERLVLFFDNDEAGNTGLANVWPRLARRLYVRVITPPATSSQPDEIPVDDLRRMLPSPAAQHGARRIE